MKCIHKLSSKFSGWLSGTELIANVFRVPVMHIAVEKLNKNGGFTFICSLLELCLSLCGSKWKSENRKAYSKAFLEGCWNYTLLQIGLLQLILRIRYYPISWIVGLAVAVYVKWRQEKNLVCKTGLLLFSCFVISQIAILKYWIYSIA